MASKLKIEYCVEPDAAALAQRAARFLVEKTEEAVALRGYVIKTPLLIVGYTRPETIVTSRLKNISFTITNIDTLRTISSILQKAVSLHIKVDTGMRRQGILLSEIDEAINLIQANGNISLDGLMSHFSDADNIDHTFTDKQIENWNAASRKFKSVFPSIKYFHMSATDGHRFTRKIEANLSRLGIGLYGLSDDTDFAKKMNLQPVLEMKTIITGIKPLKAGETTGYGNIFTAWKNTSIATIPVGYFEGLNRKLSNNGALIVLARGADTNESEKDSSSRIICPIVGRVSMNITTIEIPSQTKDKVIEIGSTVIAISNNPSDSNSIASIAKLSGTITYEIAVHIPEHLKRNVV